MSQNNLKLISIVTALLFQITFITTAQIPSVQEESQLKVSLEARLKTKRFNELKNKSRSEKEQYINRIYFKLLDENPELKGYVEEIKYFDTLNELVEQYKKDEENTFDSRKKQFIISERREIAKKTVSAMLCMRSTKYFGSNDIKSNIYVLGFAFDNDAIFENNDFKSALRHETQHARSWKDGIKFPNSNKYSIELIIKNYVEIDEIYVLDKQISSILERKENVSLEFFENTVIYFIKVFSEVEVLSKQTNIEGKMALDILSGLKNNPYKLKRK